MKTLSTLIRSTVAVTALTFVSLAAHAAKIELKADLSASQEVPANTTAGTGKLSATLNTETNELTYHVVFKGLTGPVKAAHFHGPAAKGANAGPQVAVEGSALDSPINGKATLTAEQAKQLLDGMWYFNIHTAANPDGEIRGQVHK